MVAQKRDPNDLVMSFGVDKYETSNGLWCDLIWEKSVFVLMIRDGHEIIGSVAGGISNQVHSVMEFLTDTVESHCYKKIYSYD